MSQPAATGSSAWALRWRWNMSEAGNDILWTPDPARAAASGMARFARAAGFVPGEVTALHRWSVEQPSAYHSLLWDELGIIGDKGVASIAPGANLGGTVGHHVGHVEVL